MMAQYNALHTNLASESEEIHDNPQAGYAIFVATFELEICSMGTRRGVLCAEQLLALTYL